MPSHILSRLASAPGPSASFAALSAPTEAPQRMSGWKPKTSARQRTAPTSNAPFEPPPASTSARRSRISTSTFCCTLPHGLVAVSVYEPVHGPVALTVSNRCSPSTGSPDGMTGGPAHV